jgi:hypothetical protein
VININTMYTHMVFIDACVRGDRETIERILGFSMEVNGLYVDVHGDNEHVFHTVCEHGHLDIVKLFLGLSGDRYINVHANNEGAFGWACRNGHQNVVELLLGLEGDRYIDVHAGYEYAFRVACENGRCEIVKLLLKLEGDRRVGVNGDEWVFRETYENGHYDVLELLMCLAGERAIPGRLLAMYRMEDVCRRTLIAEWAAAGTRHGNAKHEVLKGVQRVALAEVLRLLARPW